MKVLITGANGFLGRRVVDAMLKRGHSVRALVRPSAKLEKLNWPESVEVERADLRQANLLPAFEGIDALIHLAAGMLGDDDARFQSTVVGTERLLSAMAESDTKRLVLASSFSVYDYATPDSELTEASQLEQQLYQRDGYAVAKLWQEQVARKFAQDNDWDLRVLRPGFIWGEGNEWQYGTGQLMGNLAIVIGPTSKVPLTHVDNCADCFATVAEHENAKGQTYNVVDNHGVNAWQIAKDFADASNPNLKRVPLPYGVGLGITWLAEKTSHMLFGPQGKLPSILVPCRYRARFKPLKCDAQRLSSELGWSPPYDYSECLRRTYG